MSVVVFFLSFLTRTESLDRTVVAALLCHIRVDDTILAAHFRQSVERVSVGVGAAAGIGLVAAVVEANILVIEVSQLVLLVQPNLVVVGRVVPHGADFVGVLAVAHAKVHLGTDVVGATDATVALNSPSVLVLVRVDRVAVVHFYAFMTPGQLTA